MITSEAQTPEELREEVAQTLPFSTFDFNEAEILTLYGSLTTYHQHLATKDDLEQSFRVINLMAKLRPSAVEAARQLKQGGM